MFGISCLFAINIVIDYWGYGKWVFAPYNYLIQNLVENKAANFGVSPFWYYITKPFVKAVPPLTIFYLGGLIGFWIKKPRSIWTSITFSFFLIHSVIGHKEVRFLSFIYVLTPFFYCVLSEEYKCLQKKTLRVIFKFSYILNLLVLCKTSFTTTHSAMGLYEFLYKSNVEEIFVIQKNNRKFNLTMPFYMRSLVETKKFNDHSGMLITTNYNDYLDIEKRGNCENLFLSYPKVIFKLNFSNWLSRSGVYSVWSCKRP